MPVRYTDASLQSGRVELAGSVEPMVKYIALVYREGTGWGVSFPDVPGCVAVADTAEQAQENASQALAKHLAAMVANGDALPKSRSYYAIRKEVRPAVDIELAVEMRVALDQAAPVLPGKTA